MGEGEGRRGKERERERKERVTSYIDSHSRVMERQVEERLGY